MVPGRATDICNARGHAFEVMIDVSKLTICETRRDATINPGDAISIVAKFSTSKHSGMAPRGILKFNLLIQEAA